MGRPCCPSCGWTLALRLPSEVFGCGADGDVVWVAVCSNPRRLKPCAQHQTLTRTGRWAIVPPGDAVREPSEAALLRRAPVAA